MQLYSTTILLLLSCFTASEAANILVSSPAHLRPGEQPLYAVGLPPLLSLRGGMPRLEQVPQPGVELRANLKSISHRCHLFEVAFVWEMTKETIHLPLGCLQGGMEVEGLFLCA